MKSIISTVLLLVAATIAEPPVDSRYLPPQYRTTDPDRFSPPAAAAPPRHTAALLRAPSNTYGAPGQESPAAVYGAPERQRSPSTQYGAPERQRSPSSEYGAPAYQREASPSTSYGAPAAAPARQYLPARLSDDGGDGEPANYSFEYMVKDDASGNDFGHRESRMGDRAEGVYYVLLPDGRKQTVQYEADENGYRPKISYEDVGAGGAGGYPAAGGYPSGPY